MAGNKGIMNINGIPRQSIWWNEAEEQVYLFDQRSLPHTIEERPIRSYEEAATAIRDMWVRGAPLIGVTAAFGIYLAAKEAQTKKDPHAFMQQAHATLLATRPTAVNLSWALQRLHPLWQHHPVQQWENVLLEEALRLRSEDIDQCRSIGEHGLACIRSNYEQTQQPVNIMTHCNAGWLATVDYGTATAPMYLAHEAGIPIHVWVSETRPRNQGFSITAFELDAAGIPHTVLVDNAAGLLLQQGKVDLVMVGSDRTTANGDVANKIGTYLKALAAHASGVPFYVALPSSSIDFSMASGQEIPIEERSPAEVKTIQGYTAAGRQTVMLTPSNSPAVNYGFDITPAAYVTGLITERGVCPASAEGLATLFPEKFPADAR